MDIRAVLKQAGLTDEQITAHITRDRLSTACASAVNKMRTEPTSVAAVQGLLDAWESYAKHVSSPIRLLWRADAPPDNDTTTAGKLTGGKGK